jgi:4'-phosphopantetheinyl transferase
LGEHLDEEPHRIRFAPRSCSHCGSARHGKPRLDADATRGVEFNLSHSSVHVAIAVADHVAVGIDIEGGLPQDPDGIARRFFTEAERQAPLTRDAFLRLWTRKEAAMKVGGRGLAAGLAFDVLADRVELDDGSVVWVRDVAAGEPCAVAAAQEGFRIEVGRLDAPGR